MRAWVGSLSPLSPALVPANWHSVLASVLVPGKGCTALDLGQPSGYEPMSPLIPGALLGMQRSPRERISQQRAPWGGWAGGRAFCSSHGGSAVGERGGPLSLSGSGCCHRTRFLFPSLPGLAAFLFVLCSFRHFFFSVVANQFFPVRRLCGKRPPSQVRTCRVGNCRNMLRRVFVLAHLDPNTVTASLSPYAFWVLHHFPQVSRLFCECSRFS